ncbi:hypothetical protein HK097_007767 [Rhizophlyctis rosea]|uniref:Ankyrin repeat protein n=1 Tax=Rhizophlyctis rosea TaxID=64517 RepID=A0AAD5SB56_9FUNG|nr:hypothetical protein HK097_007767 [Rhizophlyctis rosea]
MEPDPDGRALHLRGSLEAAVIHGKDDILIAMIEEQFDRLTCWQDHAIGQDALRIAAKRGNVKACRALQHHFSDDMCSTFLHEAAFANQSETFDFLCTFTTGIRETEWETQAELLAMFGMRGKWFKRLHEHRPISQQGFRRAFVFSKPEDMEWFGCRAGPLSAMLAAVIRYATDFENYDGFAPQLRWIMEKGGRVEEFHLRLALRGHPTLFARLITRQNANSALVIAAEYGCHEGADAAVLAGAKPRYALTATIAGGRRLAIRFLEDMVLHVI